MARGTRRQRQRQEKLWYRRDLAEAPGILFIDRGAAHRRQHQERLAYRHSGRNAILAPTSSSDHIKRAFTRTIPRVGKQEDKSCDQEQRPGHCTVKGPVPQPVGNATDRVVPAVSGVLR